MPAEAVAPPPAATLAPAAPATIPAPQQPGMLRPSPARDKLFTKIAQKAAANDETAIAPARPGNEPAKEKPAEAPNPETQPETEHEERHAQTEPAPESKPETDKAPATDSKAKTEPAKKDRVNPWDLVKKLKSEVAEAKSSSLAEQERKDYQTRIEKAEARLKEHEQELVYTNYAKSQEFQDKYAKPYEARWKLAMSELGELTLPTADGNQRAVTAQDLLELVNLPLGAARQRANELFGDFADDVMGHRKDIKRMAEEQNQALEDAKLNGAQREKERAETMTRTQREIGETLAKSFKAEMDAAAKDPGISDYLNIKEGDDEWNAAIERGRKMAAQIFLEDSQDPKLTKEQRSAMAKRQAAVMNRATAFGPLKLKLSRLEKELAAVKKENESFKGSRPETAGGTQAPNGNGTPMKARDRVMAGIARFAGTG